MTFQATNWCKSKCQSIKLTFEISDKMGKNRHFEFDLYPLHINGCVVHDTTANQIVLFSKVY